MYTCIYIYFPMYIDIYIYIYIWNKYAGVAIAERDQKAASGELVGDGERDATSWLLDALAANGSMNSSSSNVNPCADSRHM